MENDTVLDVLGMFCHTWVGKLKASVEIGAIINGILGVKAWDNETLHVIDRDLAQLGCFFASGWDWAKIC